MIDILKDTELYLKDTVKYENDDTIYIKKDTKMVLKGINYEKKNLFYCISPNNNQEYLKDFAYSVYYKEYIIKYENFKNECEKIITEWVINTKNFKKHNICLDELYSNQYFMNDDVYINEGNDIF